MDYIKYETTLKASGREYSKIVFWNRFIRNPIELILTWLPAAITIVCIALGCFSSYLAVIYAACWCYPIYIFGFHVRSFFLFFALIFIPTSSYHDSKNSSSISHDWLDAKQK